MQYTVATEAVGFPTGMFNKYIATMLASIIWSTNNAIILNFIMYTNG
jgi:hypothetical protein